MDDHSTFHHPSTTLCILSNFLSCMHVCMHVCVCVCLCVCTGVCSFPPQILPCLPFQLCPSRICIYKGSTLKTRTVRQERQTTLGTEGAMRHPTSSRGVKLIFTGGPHQPCGCLQRAECNLGWYKCNYSLTVKRELSAATG